MPAHNTSERAEQRRLREQLRGQGSSRAEIAVEMGCRFRLRPRQAWRAAWGWTTEEAAERYNALRSKGAADAVTSLTGSRLSEWERWPYTPRRPSLVALCLLAEIYQCPRVLDLIDHHDRQKLPPEELLALDKTGAAARPRPSAPDGSPVSAARPPQEVADPQVPADGLLRAGMPPVRTAAPDGSVLVPHWPTWFGLRLAQVITLTDGWHDPSALGPLQSLLNQEILMSDAVMPHDQPDLRTVHALSRRHALMTLAALPAALAAPGMASANSPSPAAATDLFLARCAASLTSCWHLLRGSDLAAVEQTLSAYLLPLEAVAQQHSRYQSAAAQLATQAHLICGLLAFHRNALSMREHHCKRSLQYAALASDASNHAEALLTLAFTYFHTSEPQKAATVHEQAFSRSSAMAPLHRSRVHAQLAAVYGQLGREQDAIRAAGLAEELYPDDPEEDPSFLYAEFVPATLASFQGLGYVELARQFPGRGYQQKAADIFSRAGQGVQPVPDRIRCEIVNHQADTAVLLGDLDAFEIFMGRGMDGAAQLGSRKRLKELRTIYSRALARWPDEKRLHAVGDGLQYAESAE